jgi:hypothetical protein
VPPLHFKLRTHVPPMTTPHDPSRKAFRDEAVKIAEEFSKCQEQHRALMQALYDNSVDTGTFEKLSLDQHEKLLRLKRVKLELQERRTGGGKA